MRHPKLFVLSLLLLSSSQALAGTLIVCRGSVGNNSRQGYVFKAERIVRDQIGRATLKISGERALRKLTCVGPGNSPERDGFDRMIPVMYCNERNRDTGYAVTVRSGGIAGWTVATVEARNYRSRNQVLAQLRCE